MQLQGVCCLSVLTQQPQDCCNFNWELNSAAKWATRAGTHRRSLLSVSQRFKVKVYLHLHFHSQSKAWLCLLWHSRNSQILQRSTCDPQNPSRNTKIIRVKHPLLLSDLNKTWIFSAYFLKKSSNTKFNENPSSGSRVGHASGRAHMARLIVAFRNLSNAPKIWYNGPAACDTGLGQVAGCCEHGNEPSGPTKRGKFLEQLKNCWFYKKANSYTHSLHTSRPFSRTRCALPKHPDDTCRTLSKLSNILTVSTWSVQVLRYPNFFFLGNGSR